MPDITMCYGGECTKKKKCYRFTATPTPLWQAYFTEPPFEWKKKSQTCEYFVDNKDWK